MSKQKLSLRELRKTLLKALRVRDLTEPNYVAYKVAWANYAVARIEAGRRISDAEYNRLHKL